MLFIAYGGALRPEWDMFVLVCSVRCESVNYVLTGWRDDHGPNNVRAMVKITLLEILQAFEQQQRNKPAAQAADADPSLLKLHQ